MKKGVDQRVIVVLVGGNPMVIAQLKPYNSLKIINSKAGIIVSDKVFKLCFSIADANKNNQFRIKKYQMRCIRYMALVIPILKLVATTRFIIIYAIILLRHLKLQHTG